jgi:EAL domain-containing protein (putative c-di-GMP-specific phosphodiesterase class I)
MRNLSWTGSEKKPPYLEYFPDDGGTRQQIVIKRYPFRIGRSTTADYTIFSSQVSKQHAEIFREGVEVRIRDLGSTNGTFLNGQQITEGRLTNGDILHFAHREFRFVHEPSGALSGTEGRTTALAHSALPASFIRGSEHLRELLEQQAVAVHFQPIVHLHTREALGYEALGRSTHPKLNVGPVELFRLADQCQLAPQLSRTLRQVSAQEAVRLPAQARVFLNLHPFETLDEDLVATLRTIRQILRADQKLVLEVHEDMVADLRSLGWLRECLQRADIELAYDDFGAGRARLAELAEVPPNFVKLDRSLVRDIDQAATRQELIQALTRGITDLGIDLIAEGIETAAEARICRGLGCRFGQGYHLGRPQPAASFGPK